MSLLVIDAVKLMKAEVLLEQFWNSFAAINFFIFSLQGSTGMHEGKLASYPGSCGRGKKEPGTHRSRMRLIKTHKPRGF